MHHDTPHETDAPRVFIYHGTLSPFLALVLVVPVLLVFLSIAAALFAGGAVAALVLPLVLRARLRRHGKRDDVIELEQNQYDRIDEDVPRLPPR